MSRTDTLLCALLVLATLVLAISPLPSAAAPARLHPLETRRNCGG